MTAAPSLLLDAAFGPWELTPAPPSAIRSASDPLNFGPGAPTPNAPLLWRLDLPAQPERAAEQLASLQARLAADQAALAAARARLARFVAAPDAGAAAPTAFAVGSAEPETALAAELRATQSGPISFLPGSSLLGDWHPDVSRVTAEIEQLARSIGVLASVETLVEGLVIARSQVARRGGIATVWRPDVAPEAVALHTRSLGLAVDQRLAMIHTCIAVIQAGLKLYALVASPVGAILALPMAWRFVEAVLTERGQAAALTAAALTLDRPPRRRTLGPVV